MDVELFFLEDHVFVVVLLYDVLAEVFRKMQYSFFGRTFHENQLAFLNLLLQLTHILQPTDFLQLAYVLQPRKHAAHLPKDNQTEVTQIIR